VSQQLERGLKPKENEVLRIIEGEGVDKVATLKSFSFPITHKRLEDLKRNIK